MPGAKAQAKPGPPDNKGAGKKKGGAVTDATPELLSEVKAFASQLGLGAAAGTGFEYDDFAPTKAKQRPAAAAAAAAAAADGSSSKAKKTKGDGKPGASDDKRGGRDGKPGSGGKKGGFAAGADNDGLDPRAAAARARQEQHIAAVTGRDWVESVGPRPGETKGRSLLSHDEPTIWYEAALGLPALTPDPSAPPLDDAAAERLRNASEQLLEREAAVFEKDLARRNAADSRWLAQVRRGGTTADKVAAMTLLVQVGGS